LFILSQGTILQVWNIQTKQKIATLQIRYPDDIQFHPTLDQLFVQKDTYISIWDTRSWTNIEPSLVPALKGFNLQPQENTIVVFNKSKIQKYDIETRKLLKETLFNKKKIINCDVFGQYWVLQTVTYRIETIISMEILNLATNTIKTFGKFPLFSKCCLVNQLLWYTIIKLQFILKNNIPIK
jgi:WD40 repeat protein